MTGALKTGSNALKAFSERLGQSAMNLAHSKTVGYKTVEGRFVTLVSSKKNTAYSPGGVRNNTINNIEEQGIIQASNDEKHIAISGSGFLVVKDPSKSNAILYTRDGQIQQDELGNMLIGKCKLQGWTLDIDGNIPSANADSSSLSDINVSSVSGVASSTTRIELGLNLDSNEVLGATTRVLGTTPVSAATLNTQLGSPAGNVDFTISLNGGAPVTITIAPANTLATVAASIVAAFPPGTLTAVESNGKLIINVSNMTDSIEINNGTTGNVVTNLFNQGQVKLNGYDYRRPVTVYDSLGAAREIKVDFKKINTNQWAVEARVTDPSITTVPLTGLIGTGILTFNTNGDMTTITGTLSAPVLLPWDTAITGAGNQEVVFDFGIDASGNKTKGAITQFASDYSVAFINQNGSALGQKTGISIDGEGYVIASFSTGKFKRLYKIALSTFANPNGLNPVTGNLYEQTYDSGEYNLREAGKSGAGTIAESSLEMSTTDIGREFTNMIETQTSYTANTKVIQISNEMMHDLTSIIR